MSWKRLAENTGLQWPCRDENDPGAQFLHGRLWEDPIEGDPAPFSITPHSPPVDELNEEFPIRLTTGRRLESYNTGAQSNMYNSPLHRGESLDLSPEDAETLGIDDGDEVLVTSRRGAVEAPARIDNGLREGLAFMTFHFPDQVDTNVLTIDAIDPRSGTAEFKATAVRVEKLAPTDAQAAAEVVGVTNGHGAAGNGGGRTAPMATASRSPTTAMANPSGSS